MTATLDTTVPAAATGRIPFAAKLAAVSLVVGAAGNLGQTLVWQAYGGRPDTVEEQIAWAGDHETPYVVACLLGTFAIPFMAIGFVAAARLLARKARILGITAGVLLVVGMWGFQAIQVAETIQLAAILDGGADAGAAVHWMDTLDESPLLMVFGLPFLLGAPLGLLVLTIGALVKAPFPRWIAGALLAFAIVDFGFGATGPVDPHWLYVAACVGLAVHLLKDRARAWTEA